MRGRRSDNRNYGTGLGPAAELCAPSRNAILGHDPGGQAMRTVLIAAAASVSCLLATGALAQTVNTQATTAASSAANAGAPSGQQQVSPSSVITTIRRAGMGPGGFT